LPTANAKHTTNLLVWSTRDRQREQSWLCSLTKSPPCRLSGSLCQSTEGCTMLWLLCRPKAANSTCMASCVNKDTRVHRYGTLCPQNVQAEKNGAGNRLKQDTKSECFLAFTEFGGLRMIVVFLTKDKTMVKCLLCCLAVAWSRLKTYIEGYVKKCMLFHFSVNNPMASPLFWSPKTQFIHDMASSGK
jgi:hypothetical protein